MFLHIFTQEEKENFLELIYNIANCDGNYTEDEQKLIASYKSELGIAEVPKTESVEVLIQYFSEKPEQIQKIVWFELYGVIMADDVVADEEMRIINLIKDKFSISKDMIQTIQEIALELQKVYDKIYDCLF